jgi:hypothetical protein
MAAIKKRMERKRRVVLIFPAFLGFERFKEKVISPPDMFDNRTDFSRGRLWAGSRKNSAKKELKAVMR